MAALAAGAALPAGAIDIAYSGRVTFGSTYRLEAQDPNLLNSFNAAEAGLAGLSTRGQNADDANTNFRRHDATTRVLKGYLDLTASEGGFKALARVKAWRDFALADNPRAWGNIASGYAPGAPLSDSGAPLLSRFSGVALSEFFVQYDGEVDGRRATVRAGRQSLGWGGRGFPGGLSALDPVDLPATRRAGVTPQETKVPLPALFGRFEATPELALEGFYQFGFRPSALDMCGTFWSVVDYLADGCGKAFVGGPEASDRSRDARGWFIKRIAAPAETHEREYGLGLTWKSRTLGTDFGFYHARYTNRTPVPGVRKSTRAERPLEADDPDGRNIAFFLEYPGGIGMYALTFARKAGAATVFGEIAYRRNQPLQLSSGDVLGALLKLDAPALLRASANAIAPGGYFHGYDRYAVTQVQTGIQREWKLARGPALAGSVEAVLKHAAALPDQSVRRYLRADVFGPGPISGVPCNKTPATWKQCSLDGYVTANAYAYRLRMDARFGEVLPGLDVSASALFTHDVKGWSYDASINEGRRTLNLTLRTEYRKRYLAEVAVMPNWGGEYNAQSDRDQLALAAGVKF